MRFECYRCGACCMAQDQTTYALGPCSKLRKLEDGTYECVIHNNKPLNCKRFLDKEFYEKSYSTKFTNEQWDAVHFIVCENLDFLHKGLAVLCQN